jgi:hypothetical protein
MEWIEMAEDRVQWLALPPNELVGSIKGGKSQRSCVTVSF